MLFQRSCNQGISRPIFDSEEILSRTMPVWCLLNAGGRGYRALTAQCRPQQPIENVYSNRLSKGRPNLSAACCNVVLARSADLACASIPGMLCHGIVSLRAC